MIGCGSTGTIGAPSTKAKVALAITVRWSRPRVRHRTPAAAVPEGAAGALGVGEASGVTVP